MGDDIKLLCAWCEVVLPKNPFMVCLDDSNGEFWNFCNKSCRDDYLVSWWPSWMNGRIGPDPRRDWHVTGDFLCLSAPNRYRQAFRKQEPWDADQKLIVKMQQVDFPWLKNPEGLEIDYPSWDQVLVWRGQSVIDALIGEAKFTKHGVDDVASPWRASPVKGLPGVS